MQALTQSGISEQEHWVCTITQLRLCQTPPAICVQVFTGIPHLFLILTITLTLTVTLTLQVLTGIFHLLGRKLPVPEPLEASTVEQWAVVQQQLQDTAGFVSQVH